MQELRVPTLLNPLPASAFSHNTHAVPHKIRQDYRLQRSVFFFFKFFFHLARSASVNVFRICNIFVSFVPPSPFSAGQYVYFWPHLVFIVYFYSVLSVLYLYMLRCKFHYIRDSPKQTLWKCCFLAFRHPSQPGIPWNTSPPHGRYWLLFMNVAKLETEKNFLERFTTVFSGWTQYLQLGKLQKAGLRQRCRVIILHVICILRIG